MSRIGVFSGSFDPVHKGHIAFALEAAKTADLDKVYLAPEVKPRRKPGITHFAHRVAMLKLAVRSQPKLEVLELPDKYFLPQKTLAQLRQRFPRDTLVMLLGSDLFEHLVEHSEQWPHVEALLSSVELVVSARTGQTNKALQEMVGRLPVQPLAFYIAHNHQPEVSSGMARDRLKKGLNASSLPASVAKYAAENWLYHDIEKAKIESPKDS